MSTMREVLVTGSSGRFGRLICNRLKRDNDFIVTPLSRNPDGSIVEQVGDWIHKESILNKIVIHVGWNTIDRSRQVQMQCATDTAILAEMCQAYNVQFIFISSLSAVLGTHSNYGVAKYRAEKSVIGYHGKVVRPGLLLMSDGMGFERLFQMHVLKLVCPVFVFPRLKIGVNTVDETLYYLSSLLNIGEEQIDDQLQVDFLTVHELVQRLQGTVGRKIWVPTPLVIVLLKFGTIFSKRCESLRDSFLGLTEFNLTKR
jgi:NAD(P)-dependent dehydrogenase (short-subunit alcohol dehydrogenase family)